MNCRKCGSTNLGIMPNMKNPKATDLYCKDCGAWQKFATKDEIRLFQSNNRIQIMTKSEAEAKFNIKIVGD